MKTTIFKHAITSLLLIAGAVSFSSCKEEERPSLITVDETPITAMAAAGTYAIAVSSNGEWTAVVEDAANHEWCTLINASGVNNGTVTVNVAENTTLTPRSATVRIISGSLTKSVTINQETAGISIGYNGWATLVYGLGSWNIPCNVETQYVYFEGDSIVTGYSYKKVFSCDDKLHENIKYEGLIREQEKKTYFIPTNSETEYKLYDFSLEEGMIFEYIDWWYHELPPISFCIKQVDFVEINGVQKKRMKLTGLPPFDVIIYATWIEGIGSLNGLFEPCGVLAPGGNRILLCYFQNNEVVYKTPEYPECYYDKPEELIPFMKQPDIGVSVYPNPVDRVLNISSPEEIIRSVKLVDISADAVIYSNDNINTNVYTIDMSSMQRGFYGLTVWLNGKGGDFIIYKL